MAKLNDTQTLLLSTAAQRVNGSLYPLPQTRAPKVTFGKAVAALLAGGLIEERETSASDEIVRTDGDLGFGLYVTRAGLQAIGIETDVVTPEPTDTTAPAAEQAASSVPRSSKSAAVLALLARDGGATMPELIEATDWLPHTTRAALTGLRKKGHAVERTKRDGQTCYRIAVAG